MEFATAAKVGEVLTLSAEVLRRGGRIVTVEVRATGKRGRLVAVGTVTKTLRGLSKAS